MNKKANSWLALIPICSRLHAQTAPACINTTYSGEEEKQLTGDLLRLITGQFAQHGPAFYTNEVTTLTAKLAETRDDVEARNDLAAAHLKLGEYEVALGLFDEIEKTHPGRYRTQANLGVLRKKMGDFDLAAKHIEKSLKIKPEGHLGLGDYYLKMLHWKEEAAALSRAAEALGPDASRMAKKPKANFLGVLYASGPEAIVAHPDFNREYIETLIKADRHFADAMVALGDALFVEGNLELAMRAYVRAADDLHHPAGSVIYDRIHDIHDVWVKEADARNGYIVRPTFHMTHQAGMEFREAADWLSRFQETEAQMIQRGETVDFASVKAEMKALGVPEPAYLTIGVIKGTKSDFTVFTLVVGLVFFVILPCLALMFFSRLLRRMWRARKEAAATGGL